jgi:RNA polymerase sigma-70 factor (ECF subfamily)
MDDASVTLNRWMDPGQEAHLLPAARKGDRKAFAEIARAYTRPIHRLAFALTRDPDDARDLARETFVRAWKGLRHLPPDRPLYPWLARIARNLSVSLGRRRAGDGDGAPAWQRSAREEAYLAAFLELNADDQMALTMRVIEGLSYPEIAVYLEVPVRNVISRLSGARDHLRRRLAEGSGGST